MKLRFLPLLIVVVLSCTPSGGVINTGNNGDSEKNTSRWIIPKDEVFDGGPGKDGIPSIDLPQFVPGASVDFIADEELVIAVTFDSIIKVYSHSILDWHEIVNDNLDGKLFALTYCPLTGTGINWDRNIAGNGTTFGVSGLLYNSNLIPYDRKTNSNWSQMRLDCVNGLLIESKIETFPVLETTWKTVKNLPNLLVLSSDTGFSRNYGTYPYGDYKTNHNNIIFPVTNSDSRMDSKDRVLGVIKDEEVKTYSLESFDVDTIKLIIDKIAGQSIILVGSKQMNFIRAFLVDDSQHFTVLQERFPAILEDQKGNIYDVFGKVTQGPDEASFLPQPESYMGYWFAWAAFYPDLKLYD